MDHGSQSKRVVSWPHVNAGKESQPVRFCFLFATPGSRDSAPRYMWQCLQSSEFVKRKRAKGADRMCSTRKVPQPRGQSLRCSGVLHYLSLGVEITMETLVLRLSPEMS